MNFSDQPSAAFPTDIWDSEDVWSAATADWGDEVYFPVLPDGGQTEVSSQSSRAYQFSIFQELSQREPETQLHPSLLELPPPDYYPPFHNESPFGDALSTPSPIWNHGDQQYIEENLPVYSQSATPPRSYTCGSIGPHVPTLSPISSGTPIRCGSGSESDPIDIEKWENEVEKLYLDPCSCPGVPTGSGAVLPVSTSSPVPLSKEEEEEQFRARMRSRQLFVVTPSPPRRPRKKQTLSSSERGSDVQTARKKAQKVAYTKKGRGRKEKGFAAVGEQAITSSPIVPPHHRARDAIPQVCNSGNGQRSSENVTVKYDPTQLGPLQAVVASTDLPFDLSPIFGGHELEKDKNVNRQLDTELSVEPFSSSKDHDMEAELDRELQEGLFGVNEDEMESLLSRQLEEGLAEI